MAATVSRNVQIIVSMSNRLAGPANRASMSLWNMVKAARAAQIVFEGIAKTVGYFIKINQQMEDMTIQFAAFLNASGMVSRFNDSLQLSTSFVEILRDRAAKLPGEFSDYTEVASRSFVALTGAGFKSVEQMADFVSRFTAIGVMMQVPARVVGTSLELMMKGLQRNATPMWQRLSGLMGVTSDQWKRFTETERMQRLVAVFGKFNDALAASERTGSSIFGQFNSNVQQIAMLASNPAYEQLKRFLYDLNEILAENKQFLASLLQTVVKLTLALGVLKLVSSRLEKKTGLGLMEWMKGKVSIRNPFAAGTKSVTEYIKTIPPELYTHAGQRALPGVTALSTFVRGGRMPRPGTGEGVAEYMNLTPVTRQVPLTLMERAGRGFKEIGTGIWGVVRAIGPWAALIAAVALLVYGLTRNLGGMRDQLENTFGRIAALFEPFRKLVGDITGNYNLLENAAMLVGAFVDAIGQVVGFVLQFVGTLSGFIGSQLSNLFELISAVANGRWNQASALVNDLVNPVQQARNFKEIWDQVGRDAEKFQADEKARMLAEQKKAKINPPDARNGPPVYDFRGSKFTITQQFAEGFDPDRIAVAFADDLAALADRRLQSAFSPVGAI